MLFPMKSMLVLSLTSIGDESDFSKKLVITTVMKAVFE